MQGSGLKMRKDGQGPITCFACGGIGHMQGDDVCPLKPRSSGATTMLMGKQVQASGNGSADSGKKSD